jgi:murein DD-endopeptidase MepM/ murein hydrolase activator NlpD
VLWVLFLSVGLAVSAFAHQKHLVTEREFSRAVDELHAEATRIRATFVMYSVRLVPRGLPFGGVLQSAGVDPFTTTRVVSAIQPVFDLRQFRAGNRVDVGRSVLGELRQVVYHIDAERILEVRPAGSHFNAHIETLVSHTETSGVSGVIHGSLFESITRSGESPELALRLAEIFAYDLDFYTDPRPGDTFHLVVEKKILPHGVVASYGRILAAEYDNAGKAFRAVCFHDETGHEAYYTPEGKSLKRAFLHSPLKFAAPVTSHFSMARFHPILKTYRAHLGTDYGAPTGTPVQAIADGRAVFAGPKGGAGNLVEIEHSNGYETYYMHLSRILVRNGQRVSQGDRIGQVGMTGLATGPHLDFRIEQRGKFLNFEGLHLPSSEPIARRDWAAFVSARDHSLALLPAVPTTVAANALPASPLAQR